jgi:DNA-binding SARP family transcriptional activator
VTNADALLDNPVIRLITLGGASLRSSDAAGTVLFRPGKPLALIIYLASSPRHSASREHLLNLLWADVDPERGLRTLRQTVFNIRQALGEHSIASEGRDLSFTIPIAFDRDDFATAIASGENERAVALYTGSFLPDFGVPGGAEFEQWADRERDRLHSAYTRAAESVIRSSLDHARYNAAVSEARRLRDFDRHNESSWRILLEALSSSGDSVSAVIEAEELERFLASEEREPESLTRSAIARAKKTRAASAVTVQEPQRLIAELTGRDREFSRLTSAWTAVKAGHFHHIHITASPGLGKTRLLRDAYTRLRASGARALWIGAIAGDRRLAYALASDIVGKAGNLSGAGGISTAAASTLIALNPKLSSSFSATPDRSVDDEAMRNRVHAVAELFEALADEMPIAVFIDDMHWSDTVSRQLLKSAFSRVGESRILLITSARLIPDGSLNLPATVNISLEPLDEDQVWQMVSSFASIADKIIGQRFIHALHEHTGGSPLLVLENVHLALDRNLLDIRDAAWHFSDVDLLVDSISRGDALEQRLRKLDPRLFHILLLLGIAEEPISVTMVTSASGADRATVEADLGRLEQHGLAASEGDSWQCAHDTIAEAVIRMAPERDHSALHAALGTTMAHATADLDSLRIAMRHLSAANNRGDVERLFARSVKMARASGDRRSNTQLAASMLGEISPSHEASRLVASLPVTQRFGISNRTRALTASAMLLAAIAIPLGLQPAKPTQLLLISKPLAASPLLVPAPVIEIADANGRRVRGAADTIYVDTVRSVAGIGGTLKVVAVDGRAEFKDINVTAEGEFQLRFHARGLKDVLSRRLNVTGTMPTLRLVSGVVNSQTLDSNHRSIVVKPGDVISGDLMLEYSSYWPSSSVILGAAALWGDRTKNFVDLNSLFTPTERQPRRANIKFKAPVVAGHYYIVLAFDAEGNVEDFMSGTNWRLPAPIWNDGNDIADWSPEQMAQANALGWTMTRFIKIDDATGKPVTLPHPIAATAIDITVR